MAGLGAAGFDSNQPIFFTWLGVVPYLTEGAVSSTLRFIASLPMAHTWSSTTPILRLRSILNRGPRMTSAPNALLRWAKHR